MSANDSTTPASELSASSRILALCLEMLADLQEIRSLNAELQTSLGEIHAMNSAIGRYNSQQQHQAPLPRRARYAVTKARTPPRKCRLAVVSEAQR
ncbi:hypothetical protein SLS58_002916 [Diplodia intermedia]|uniref:Uncharacterized protein n=1 Tax=Diplodia intermedia TaxID=856260 RepID=A0ABR3TY01_9PEZI